MEWTTETEILSIPVLDIILELVIKLKYNSKICNKIKI